MNLNFLHKSLISLFLSKTNKPSSSPKMHSFISSAWPFRPLSYYLKPGLALLNRLSTLVVMVIEKLICLYYRFCGLSPCTIDLDDRTIMHFWIPSYRRFNKPDLVLLHGYGGNARWQFIFQVGPLAKSFNLYFPDLLFFGRSYTTRLDRTEAIQAECVREGLRRLGVERFTLMGHSYGGFVAYRMAEMYPKAVEKIVIMSSGVKYTEGQKIGHLSKIGIEKDVLQVALLDNPKDLLFFLNLCMSLSMHHHKLNPLKWIPDFFLRGFISGTNKHSTERAKLVEHHFSKKGDHNPPVLAQKSLLIWGDEDNVFPLFLGKELHSHLGPQSRMEIVKDTGHAVNIESPRIVNNLIKSFVLGGSDI